MRNWQGGMKWAVVTGVLLAVSACDFGAQTSIDANGVIVPVGSAVSSMQIGPAGGTVTSTDARAVLVVPPGALSQAQTVSIITNDLDDEDVPDQLDDDERQSYTIDSGGRSFEQPVTLRIDAGPTEPGVGSDEFSVDLRCLVETDGGDDLLGLLPGQRQELSADGRRSVLVADLDNLADRLTTVHVAELTRSPVTIDFEGAVASLSVDDAPVALEVSVQGEGVFIDAVNHTGVATGGANLSPLQGALAAQAAGTTQPRFRGDIDQSCVAAGPGAVQIDFDIVLRPSDPERSVFPIGGATKRFRYSSPLACRAAAGDDDGGDDEDVIGRLPLGFQACNDNTRCGALEQGGLLQSRAAVVPAWDGAPAEDDSAPNCRLTTQACAFGPYDNPPFTAVVASGDGPVSAVDLEDGQVVGSFLGGQDPFFGPNRHFAPLGVLPLLPDVPNGEQGAAVLAYGRAGDASSTVARFQHANPPPEEFRDPGNPNDFGREFSHVLGNDFFLDARPFGGDLIANGGLLASDSGLRLFRFNADPQVFAYNTFRFVDIGPVLSAEVVNTDTVNPGPALALQDSAIDGALLQHVNLEDASVITVGNLAPNPRQLRCAAGLCFATSAGIAGDTPSQLRWWQWDGQSASVTELGTLVLGGTGDAGDTPFAQVIGLDVVEFDNGNVGAVAFGFANGTVYEVAVSGVGSSTPGMVARQGQTQTSTACPNPGHGRWTTDAGRLRWLALCNTAGGFEIGEARIAGPAP